MTIVGHLSIKSKLILMLLSTSLCSILVVGYLGYDSGRDALTRSIVDHLTSVRVLKTEQIRSYFTGIRNHTATLGEDEMVVSAMKDMKAAYGELSERPIPPAWDEAIHTYYKEDFIPKLAPHIEGTPTAETYVPEGAAARYLQFLYIATNQSPEDHKQDLDRVDDDSRYAAVHPHYNPLFRSLAGRFGYQDLLLIDIDTGDIVYSVAKEPEFATNLNNGPYRESGLANLFRALRAEPDKGAVKIADFKAYRPAYATPQAFIATPIFDGKKAIGVLALQIPADQINDVMTGARSWKQQGLGDTGETYLVGPAGFMRSDSRFLIEDRESYKSALRETGVPDRQIELIDRMNTSILLQEVDTEGVREAHSGKEDTRFYPDYRGAPVIGSYAPARIEGLDWVVLSEIDLAEVNAPIEAFERRVLISSSILVFAITLLALLLSVLFIRPINTLIEGARRVGKGDHDVVVSLKSRDELGELADTFNEMVRGIRRQTEVIEQKNRENEALLLNILPGPVAQRLKAGEAGIADTIQQATVLFADVVGFTSLAEQKSAEEAAALLNELVDSFDDAAEQHGVEKVKTIGDKYLAVCGLSVPRLDHARRAAMLAKDMQAILRQFNQKHRTALALQIGVNSGPVTAGIIGAKKFIYDMWGETVNIAGRLHAEAAANTILVTQSVYGRLHDVFVFEERGDVAPAGKSPLVAWELKDRPDAAGAVEEG